MTDDNIDDWEEQPWTREELQSHYRDEQLARMHREHAFYRYWQPYFAGTEHVLTSDEIAELTRYRGWGATASLIGDMAIASQLPADSLKQFAEQLPEDS